MPITTYGDRFIKSNEIMLFYADISWFHQKHTDDPPKTVDDFTAVSREMKVLGIKYQGEFYRKIVSEIFGELERTFLTKTVAL